MSTEKKYSINKRLGVIVLDAAHVIALSSSEPLKKEQIPDWTYEICTANYPLPYKEVRDKEVFTYVKLDYLRQILSTADDLGIRNDKGHVKISFAPNSFIKVSWGKAALYVAPIDQKKQKEYESEIQISNTDDKSTDPK